MGRGAGNLLSKAGERGDEIGAVMGVCVCVCVCVEWVLHTTHGVYGFPINGHTWGITKLDIILEIYSHLHTLNLNIIVCECVCRVGAAYNSRSLRFPYQWSHLGYNKIGYSTRNLHLHTLNLNIIELLALQCVCRVGAVYNSPGLQQAYRWSHRVRHVVSIHIYELHTHFSG